jgi:hypothetical protein
VDLYDILFLLLFLGVWGVVLKYVLPQGGGGG